jgi:hypothetical protein
MLDRIETLTRELTTLRRRRHVADKQLHALVLKVTEIQLNLAVQDKTLGKLDTAVHGNGKPGLLTRLDRVERVTTGLVRTVWLLAAATVSAAAKFLVDRVV